jgi:septation ring formation regulator EzrA
VDANIATMKTFQENATQHILGLQKTSEGQTHLVPQIVQRISEAETLFAEQGKHLENKLDVVEKLHVAQNTAFSNVQNSLHVMEQKFENNTQQFCKMAERVAQIEARPTTVVLQTPPDGNKAPK